MNPFYKYPTVQTDLKIAVVGDYPLKDGQSSFSGSFWFNIKNSLEQAGISIDSVLLCSVLTYYPGFRATGRNFNWNDSKVKECCAQLDLALRKFKPDLIISLGSLTLKHIKPGSDKLDAERGAPFKTADGILGIASYHPRDLFMFPENTTLAVHDIKKGVRLAREKWDYPEFTVDATPTFGDAIRKLNALADKKVYIASDIETLIKPRNIMTCCGIAWRTSGSYEALVIPFKGLSAGKRYWNKTEEKAIWVALNRVLRECPMVGHNAVRFDHGVLAEEHHIQANYVDDTMFAHWECYPEFLKSLGFVNSIYNDDPYWKSDHKQAGKTFKDELIYCGKDCIATLKCAVAIGKEIKERPPALRDHYKFNIRVSRAYQYMAFTGARVDLKKKNERIAELDYQREHYQKIIEKVCGKGFNVGSTPKMKEFLYGKLGLKEVKKRKKNARGEEVETVTADNLTLLHMAREHPEFPILEVLGTQRKLKKRISALVNLKHHPDGRIGWDFNVVGTETGRSSGYKPRNGLGVQPQNVDRRDRDLYLPPEDYHWCKADLEGADSVTVAACLESLGDDRLHVDLKAGVKPAQTLALAMALKDNGVMQWPVEKIKESLPLLKQKENKDFYRVAKAINHGSAYLLSPGGMHSTIFNQSDGDLYILPKECDKMQKLLFARYDYTLYHRQMETIMNSGAVLRTEFGQERHFFGRKDNSTKRKMLAYLPQAHTAYVTNRAIERLYYQPQNREPDGSLFLRLCNQVHDETDFYIPHGQEERASEVFNSVKEVPLRIWDVDFQILFEAEYGPTWGIQPYSL